MEGEDAAPVVDVLVVDLEDLLGVDFVDVLVAMDAVLVDRWWQ